MRTCHPLPFLLSLGLCLVSAQAQSPSPADNSSPALIIRVVDITPDLAALAEVLSSGKALQDSEVLRAALKASYDPGLDKPAPNVRITITPVGRKDLREGLTDQRGVAAFRDLPPGNYSLQLRFATESPLEGYQNHDLYKQTTDTTSQQAAYLIRRDLLTLRGTVVDLDGQPVPNAMVMATLHPLPEVEDRPFREETHSSDDGTFTISNIPPAAVPRLAGYLIGGNVTESGSFPFFIQLEASAPGYSQTDKSTLVVPPIGERELQLAEKYKDMLLAARAAEGKPLPQVSPPFIPHISKGVISDLILTLKKE